MHSMKEVSSLKQTFCLPTYDLQCLKNDLLTEILCCQLRGLAHGVTWLSDFSKALSADPTLENIHLTANQLTAVYEEAGLLKYLDTYALAKSYFDREEFDCCAHTLRSASKEDVVALDAPCLYFLYAFAKFKAVKKRLAEASLDPQRTPPPEAHFPEELASLKREMEQRDTTVGLDAYACYVLGLVHLSLGTKQLALEAWLKAVRLRPTFWPAWFELSQHVESRAALQALQLPEAWMKYCCCAKAYLALHEEEMALLHLRALSEMGFAASQDLCTDIAVAYQNMRLMDYAKEQFHIIHTVQPTRLTGMDLYSNVLFVLEDRATLAYLAHHFIKLYKLRPETCCIVGNFYSLRGDHDKAVVYFQRALKLKPNYGCVWTLLGHEYMELSQAHAAVHHYRKAVEHWPKEYRAWYGLGQCYELLHLPTEALFYYSQASTLKHTDARIFLAMGKIYQQLRRRTEAKQCFWRAYAMGDKDGTALLELARCFEAAEERDEAAAAYMRLVEFYDKQGLHAVEDLCAAYTYLARYHFQRGDYASALTSAYECMDYASAKEEGKLILGLIAEKQKAATANNMGTEQPPQTVGEGAGETQAMDATTETDNVASSTTASRTFPLNLAAEPVFNETNLSVVMESSEVSDTVMNTTREGESP